MSVSLVSNHSQLMDGSRSEGEGPKTASSQTSFASNRVAVEQIFPQHNHVTMCLLPEPMGALHTSVLRGQSCSSKIYTIDSGQRFYNESSEAQLSAFLSEVDPSGNHIVELCCDPAHTDLDYQTKSYFRFEFEDEIRKVQLLPLPLSTALQREPSLTNTSYTSSETLGALLIVMSKRSGMSVHSLILSRKSNLDAFHVAEFGKVSRGPVEDTGPFMEVSLYLDNTRDDEGKALYAPDPVLYAAFLSINPLVRSHRIDVLACPLVCHKSPLFHFDTRGPTRALKRSLVLTGVGSAKGISIAVRRMGRLPFCTIAALFDSEMKIIALPSLNKWSKQMLKPKDIMTVPFNPNSTGTPSLVIPLAGSKTSTNIDEPVKFAILCYPCEPLSVSREPQTQLLSPLPYEVSPSSTLNAERRRLPPQWTAEETKNAVLRARRDVMANVLLTLHGEDHLRKGLSPFQPFDESCLQTPRGADAISSNDSAVWDENFDISIASPDTAVLDMSGKWLSRSMSDSIMSPLAGIGFTGNDDSSLMSFRSNDKNCRSPRHPQNRPRMSDNPRRPAQLVIVSLSDIATTIDSANSVTTHVHDLPLEFPSCFEAVSMKGTENAIILAGKPPSSSEVRVLSIPMTRGQLSANPASCDEMCPVQIKRQLGWKVNALDLEIGAAGQIRLRVLTTKNTDNGHGTCSPGSLTEYVVNTEATIVSETISQGGELSSSSPPQHNDIVTEKLDRIMSTLFRFESNVNERLSQMEKKMNEDSMRLARLEKNISRRAEI